MERWKIIINIFKGNLYIKYARSFSLSTRSFSLTTRSRSRWQQICFQRWSYQGVFYLVWHQVFALQSTSLESMITIPSLWKAQGSNIITCILILWILFLTINLHLHQYYLLMQSMKNTWSFFITIKNLTIWNGSYTQQVNMLLVYQIFHSSRRYLTHVCEVI